MHGDKAAAPQQNIAAWESFTDLAADINMALQYREAADSDSGGITIKGKKRTTNTENLLKT